MGEAGHIGARSEAMSALINRTGPQDAPRHSINHTGWLSRRWLGLSHLGPAWEQILSLGHVLDVATWFQRPGVCNGPGTAPGLHLPWKHCWAYCMHYHDRARETALGPDPTSPRLLARPAPDVNNRLSAKVGGSPAALDQLRTYPFAFEILT